MALDADIEETVRRLMRLEDELERKFAAQRERFHYHLEEKRAVFEAEALRRHKRIRTGLLTFLRKSPFATIIVAPAVYGLILPIALLDLGVYIFQLVCFSAWGMARIDRSEFVIVDRHRLANLNGIEKLNCAYCGYANGVDRKSVV